MLGRKCLWHLIQIIGDQSFGLDRVRLLLGFRSQFPHLQARACQFLSIKPLPRHFDTTTAFTRSRSGALSVVEVSKGERAPLRSVTGRSYNPSAFLFPKGWGAQRGSGCACFPSVSQPIWDLRIPLTDKSLRWLTIKIATHQLICLAKISVETCHIICLIFQAISSGFPWAFLPSISTSQSQKKVRPAAALSLFFQPRSR